MRALNGGLVMLCLLGAVACSSKTPAPPSGGGTIPAGPSTGTTPASEMACGSLTYTVISVKAEIRDSLHTSTLCVRSADQAELGGSEQRVPATVVRSWLRSDETVLPAGDFLIVKPGGNPY